jgi:hypothetical protein
LSGLTYAAPSTLDRLSQYEHVQAQQIVFALESLRLSAVMALEL